MEQECTWVYIDTLPAGHRVDTDNRVNALDRFSADGKSCSTVTVSLSNGTVDGSEPLEVFLEARAEGGVEGIAVIQTVRHLIR